MESDLLPSLAFISIFSLDALRPGFRPRFPLSLRSWSFEQIKYHYYIENMNVHTYIV